MKRKNRSRLIYSIIIFIVILLGLGSRQYSHFFPDWLNLYLGDILWALMVFLGVGLLFRNKSTTWVFVTALLFSFLIELSQLYHAPWIDSIRNTTLGGLILGYGFLWRDLLSYTLGVSLGAVAEILLTTQTVARK